MADELGFEINSDARGAINALSELMDSLRNTSRTLQDTLNATSQGNIASSIAEQAEAAHAALDGLGLDEFDSQEARLQSAVASASAAFENQAAKINILAAEIERLEHLQDEIDDDDDAAMDRSTIALAKKQLALSQAQQKLASYGVQLEVAKQKLDDLRFTRRSK